MVLDETYMDQIFKFNVCDDPSQVTGKHILTPADHSQSIDIPLTKNRHRITTRPLFLRTRKLPLRRSRRKNNFRILTLSMWG